MERDRNMDNDNGGPSPDEPIQINITPPEEDFTPDPDEVAAAQPEEHIPEQAPQDPTPTTEDDVDDRSSANVPRRPEQMSADIEFLPSLAIRREWLDEEIEERERNSFAEFHGVGEIFRTLRENVLNDPKLTPSEKANELNTYLLELQSREWNHMFHLHTWAGNFEATSQDLQRISFMLPGLIDSIPGLRMALRAYEGINPQTGENNNFSVFQQPSAVKARFEDELRETIENSFKENPDPLLKERAKTIAKVAQRAAERIYISMAIANQAGSIVIREDRFPQGAKDPRDKEGKKTINSLSEWQSMNWEDQLKVVKSLPDWYQQIDARPVKVNGVNTYPNGQIDINASFRSSLPNDMGKLMYWGYRLEWDARTEDPTNPTLPKPPPEMKSHVMLPDSLVGNLLQVGGRANFIWNRATWENGVLRHRDQSGRVIGQESKKNISRVEELADRLKAQSASVNLKYSPSLISWLDSAPPAWKNATTDEDRAAVLKDVPWFEMMQYIDVAKTESNIQAKMGSESNTGAPFFTWAGRLNAAKKLQGEYEGMAVNPSVPGVMDVLKHVNPFSRDDKEALSKLILGKGFDFVTKFKEKYFQGKNLSKESASNMFSAANSAGFLSLKGVADIYEEKFDNKATRFLRNISRVPVIGRFFEHPALRLLIIKSYLKLLDVGGAAWKVITDILKKGTGGK